jgi:hypothetical protein
MEVHMKGFKLTPLRVGLVVGAIAAVSAPSIAGAVDGGVPASKATVAIDSLIDLSQSASGSASTGGNTNSTGWVDVLSSTIKTSSQKDLLFDVSMQCGIVTDTTVKSTNGSLSAAAARGTVAVRVLVDGVPAEPSGSIDATKATAEGVVYCDRIQELKAKFSGLNCTADAETGVVTCADPEELQLILKTLNASAFNFAKDDVGVGVHTVTVQAKADAAVNFDDDESGASLAGAEAFLGAGALIVEEVRLVKGQNISVDLQ